MTLGAMGINPLMTALFFITLPMYFVNLFNFYRKRTDRKFKIKLCPHTADKLYPAGMSSGHYFHQDLWVAQEIFQSNPQWHGDVGSRIDGFVAHVASFRPITVFDVRKMTNQVKNIEFVQMDITRADLDSRFAGAFDSISCLHAIEHFGLGRYGDPIFPDGHVAGLKTLNGMLKPGGVLYLGFPMGDLRVEFDAQRVFSLQYMLDLTTTCGFDLACFSYIDDQGSFHPEMTLDGESTSANFGCAILKLKK